ncbi:MAG TPA: hypothetical protein VNO35_29680 [Steroidobacteraceae bacterium]|nr:hypothetical protein [Steroidobacteraceae bacterium]
MKFVWRPVAAAVAALFALVTVAQPAHADGAAEHAAIIERLIAKGSANSLATVALLKQFGAESDTGSYPLITRAVQIAPERRDLAWLAVRLCASSSDCDDSVPEKHLRDVDPTNGIRSIGALTRAQRKNDAAAIDAALTAMGSSERFYVYFDPLVAATAAELVEAQRQRAAPSRKELSRATVEMIGAIAASVLPPSQSFSYSCKGLALEQVSGRLDRCRRAAQAIARADTFIVEGLGLSLQQRLWPEDSPEGQSITALRRVFQYRLQEYSRLDISSSKLDEFPADALDAFRAHEREQDVALAYFAKAGVPADPPANWTSRSLPRVP